jgi:hypothetical protein
MKLKSLLTESVITPAAKFCLDYILSLPQFSRDKWSAIGVDGHKKIGTTNTPSEHATGNAIDWHGKQGVGDPVMQQLADYLVDNADMFNAQYIIYNTKIWSRSQGWYIYNVPRGGSKHLDHVHVDFKRNATEKDVLDNASININKKVMHVVYSLYNILVKNPSKEKYFGQFSSMTPVYIKPDTDGNYRVGSGDDEKAAAKWFITYYRDNFKKELDGLLKIANKEERSNIGRIQYIVSNVYNAILNGDEWSHVAKFYVYDPVKQQYKSVPMKFDWNFL